HHYYNLMVQLGPLATKISQYCRKASVARNAELSCETGISEVRARLKLSKSIDRAELSRMKSTLDRVESKVSKVASEARRAELGRIIKRLRLQLHNIRPKRGAAVGAIGEAAALIARIVTNREQAKRLISGLTKIST